MRRLFLIGSVVIILGLAGTLAGALPVDSLFVQANAAYKEGRYDAAIEDYKKIIGLGLESGNLYYNLGNSYFKKGEPGQALLHYERALRFIPRDSDLRFNHAYVLSSLDLSPEFFGNRFERLAQKLLCALTTDALTLLLSASYILAILTLIGFLYIPGFKKAGRIILAALVVLSILCAVSLSRRVSFFERGAVVIAKEAKAQFEPVAGATTYFKLAEGQKVERLQEAGGWFKIRRPDGKTGWVEKGALGAVLLP